jgi:hypothetical protein
LIEGSGEDELRQGHEIFFAAGFCGFRTIAIDEPLNDGEPVLAGHLHVEKDEIGMVFVDEIDGLNAVRALGNDIYIPDGIEQVLELVASQLFVIDNERGDGHEGPKLRL